MTYNMTPSPSPASPPRRRGVGLPFVAIVGLAALGLPRAILHDLHLIDDAGILTWILALGPYAAWIAVAVAKRVPRPFLTVLLIGVTFGVMLVITHQLLWVQAFSGNLPAIGQGALATVIPRLAAVVSGLFTGAIIGAVGGLIAWGIRAAMTRSSIREG